MSLAYNIIVAMSCMWLRRTAVLNMEWCVWCLCDVAMVLSYQVTHVFRLAKYGSTDLLYYHCYKLCGAASHM